MLTTRQVARHCKVTVDTVRRWHRLGRLPAAGRTPKGWLFKVEDLQAFLNPATAALDKVLRGLRSA